MSGFDRDTLIKNIQNILDNENISQADLGKIMGTVQSRVSLCLGFDKKKNPNFTINQLVALADEYDLSVDALLGRTAPSDIIRTLSGIFDMLFTLDENVDIEFKQINSQNEYLHKFLTKWLKTKTALSDGNIDSDVYQLWKEKELNHGRNRLLKWGFRTEYEEGQRLAQKLLALHAQENDDIWGKLDPPPETFSSVLEANEELIESYINKSLELSPDNHDYQQATALRGVINHTKQTIAMLDDMVQQ